MVEIKAKGFKLRSYRRSDAPAVARNINNRKIARALAEVPYPYTERDAREFIDKALRAGRRAHADEVMFAIDIDGEVVGALGLHKIEDFKAELGYWLAEPYWGRGIMTRAVRMVTGYAMKELGLRRVYSRVFVFNTASTRVLEKAGFIREGLLRKECRKNGRLADMYIYAKVR